MKRLCAVCVRPDGPVGGSLVHHHAGAPETLRQIRRADPEGQRDVHDPAAHPDGRRPDGAADGAPQPHAARERAPGAVQHEARRGGCLQVANQEEGAWSVQPQGGANCRQKPEQRGLLWQLLRLEAMI